MDRPIARRDFLQGAAIGVGGMLLGGLAPELVVAAEHIAEQDRSGYYPPTRLGMRGSHPGSFEAAHALRDSRSLDRRDRRRRGESFDLIVVGAGISGLAAAHFFRTHSPRGRVLDPRQSRRFRRPRQAQRIPCERPHAPPERRHDAHRKPTTVRQGRGGPDAHARCRHQGARRSVHEQGRCTSRSVCIKACSSIARRSAPTGWSSARATAAKRLRRTWLRRRCRRACAKTSCVSSTATRTTCRDSRPLQKKDRLSRISYEHYLLKVVKADPGVLPYYLHATDGWWGCGIDAVSALDCWGT